MSADVQHNYIAGTGDNEILIYLLDRKSPVSLVLSSGWTAEYVTRKIAVRHLGVGPVVLEVRWTLYYCFSNNFGGIIFGWGRLYYEIVHF